MLRSPIVQGVVLLIVVSCAYAGSFAGKFVFDDRRLLIETPDIEHASLMHFGVNGSVAAGRPLTAASFWLNLTLDPSRSPVGFHAFNLLVHVACVVFAFALLRRTLPSMPGAGFACALVWGVHPLLTSAVTYIAQRAESLVSMCILAALYFGARRWSVACVAAGFAAVLCKEVAVVLPLLVLLHDRCFGAGSVRRALAARPRMYAGLAASWPLLALLVAQGARTASVGFEMHGLNALNYALSQPRAVLQYLELIVWPDPLVLDYGWPVVQLDAWAAYLPSLLAVLALVVLSVGLLARNHAFGFAGAWFFLLLAPSSSVLPIATEIMAEHRVYLASLAPVTLLVLGGRMLARRTLGARAPLAMSAAVGLLSLLMAAVTDAQNQLYRSDMLLWSHNLLATPDNPRVLLNLGRVLQARGQLGPALVLFERAAAASRACRRPLQPFLPEILDSSADAWERAGKLERANQLRADAWELDRSHGERAAALAIGLRKVGHIEQMLAALRAGVQFAPDDRQLRAALMAALLEAGEIDQARVQLHALAPPSQWPMLDRQLDEHAMTRSP